MERCVLCDMNVRNVKIHWKLNHKMKKSYEPGFTGFTPEHRKAKSTSVTVKKESTTPDIIARIVPHKSSLVPKSTGHNNADQSGSSVSNTKIPNFSTERNLSLLQELLNVEHEGVSRTEIMDIISSGGKVLSDKSFEFKLMLMGLIRMQKKCKEDDSRFSKFDTCPDCHQKFEYSGSRLKRGQGMSMRREYMDHVKNCGLEVGIGCGATMKVIQHVVCEPKIECTSEDSIEPHEMLSGVFKTEFTELVKQEPHTNETAYNYQQSGFIKSEVIDNDVEQDSQTTDRAITGRHIDNPLLMVKKETEKYECTNMAQDDDSSIDYEDLKGFIKSEVRKETESLVRKETEHVDCTIRTYDEGLVEVQSRLIKLEKVDHGDILINEHIDNPQGNIKKETDTISAVVHISKYDQTFQSEQTINCSSEDTVSVDDIYRNSTQEKEHSNQECKDTNYKLSVSKIKKCKVDVKRIPFDQLNQKYVMRYGKFDRHLNTNSSSHTRISFSNLLVDKSYCELLNSGIQPPSVFEDVHNSVTTSIFKPSHNSEDVVLIDSSSSKSDSDIKSPISMADFWQLHPPFLNAQDPQVGAEWFSAISGEEKIKRKLEVANQFISAISVVEKRNRQT